VLELHTKMPLRQKVIRGVFFPHDIDILRIAGREPSNRNKKKSEFVLKWALQ
jgi:hypothetical protein